MCNIKMLLSRTGYLKNKHKMIEKAIFITKTNGLKYWKKEYNRIYFGIEFCQNLIPELEQIKRVFRFVKENKLKFSYVTPLVTEDGLNKLNKQFEYLKKNQEDIEIIVNDWGILRLLSRKYNNCFSLVLGRLLTKQRRDPLIVKAIGKVPDQVIEHFRQSNVSVPIFQDFLIKKNIKRVEIDNLLQGIGDNLSKSKINASLYYPYAYVTTTRLCLLNSCDIPELSDRIGIFPCKKECQKYSITLSHKTMPVKLLMGGNTQFFINKKLPPDMEKRGINRMVYQPEMPI